MPAPVGPRNSEKAILGGRVRVVGDWDGQRRVARARAHRAGGALARQAALAAVTPMLLERRVSMTMASAAATAIPPKMRKRGCDQWRCSCGVPTRRQTASLASASWAASLAMISRSVVKSSMSCLLWHGERLIRLAVADGGQRRL